MTEDKIQYAIESINDLCDCQLEYDTRHGDAGDAYSHMPVESWCEQKTRDFIEELLREKFESCEYVQGSGWIDYKPQWKVLGIDPRWKDIDTDLLADMALESFDMVAGSIWGCFEEGIALDSYHVGEIEIELDHLGIDVETMDLIRESCEAYISGTDRAYVSTDAVWYALLNVEAFNCQIENHFIA